MSKEQLHELVNRLPESEITSAARYLEFLISEEQPVDSGMLARIDAERTHPSPGIRTRRFWGSFACDTVCLGASRAVRSSPAGSRRGRPRAAHAKGYTGIASASGVSSFSCTSFRSAAPISV